MSFGNSPLRRTDAGRSELGTGHNFGRSLQRRGPVARRNDVQRQAQPARESAEGFHGSSTTDLSVVTAEGDRITISLAAQVQYAHAEQSSAGGRSRTVESSSSASQLRVSVQGDLSDAELKDLGTLLANLSKAQSAPASTELTDPSAGLASVAGFAYRYQSVEAGSYLRLRG